jgi:hypothetical protein
MRFFWIRLLVTRVGLFRTDVDFDEMADHEQSGPGQIGRYRSVDKQKADQQVDRRQVEKSC